MNVCCLGMAVADPIKEFDPSKVPGLAEAAAAGQS